jgi:hypothetical protein
MVDHGGIYLIHKPTCAILFLHVSYGLTMVTTIKTYENTMFPGKNTGSPPFCPTQQEGRQRRTPQWYIVKRGSALVSKGGSLFGTFLLR